MHFLRSVALTFIALVLAISSTSAAAIKSIALPAPHSSGLQNRIDAFVERARSGMLGVAVLDLFGGLTSGANVDQAFPMMSVFKAPIAAAVLDRVERGELSMDQTVTIKRGDLESGTRRDHFRSKQMQLTLRDSLSDAVRKSDNTAADALLKLVGDPRTVTTFLQGPGILGMRVDLGESEVSMVFSDLQSDEQVPDNETDARQLARLRRGYAAYLFDPRNRSTPDAGRRTPGQASLQHCGADDFCHLTRPGS